MNGVLMAEKIYAGYARAGVQTGFSYDVFRAVDAVNPLAGAPVAQDLRCSLSREGRFAKPAGYGEPLWWSYHDGRITRVGDYLAGHMGVFFVAAQQDLLPILLVQCNRTLTLWRPGQSVGVGAVAYAAEQDVSLLSGWAASVLQQGKGERNQAQLPLDVQTSWWHVLMPVVPGVRVQVGDVLGDDLGRRLVVEGAELSELGWRLQACQIST